MHTNTFISDTATGSKKEYSASNGTDSATPLSEKLTPIIVGAIDKTEAVVRKSIDTVRTGARSSTDRAFATVDRCAVYVTERPLKSVATAAALGAIAAFLWCKRGE